METVAQAKTLKNIVFGTEPESMREIDMNEAKIESANRSKRILATVKTPGFQDIMTHVLEEMDSLTYKCMKNPQIEDEVKLEATHKYQSLDSLIGWIEKTLREGQEVIKELSTEINEGGEKSSLL